MESHELLGKEYALLHCLSLLPQKMLRLSDQDNISEFVLHELCCSDCFNLKKAAYFIDNPEFNCLQGVAGFFYLEAYPSAIWANSKNFSEHMRNAPFNQQVRHMRKESLKKSHKPDEVVAQEIAHDLGFTNSGFHSWNGKYQNHGILIFEHPEKKDESCAAHLINGAGLLSFCPIF